MLAGQVAYEISSEKVKHRAERRAQNETFALVPSFLQGYTSIDRKISEARRKSSLRAKGIAQSVLLYSLPLALCKLVHCSEAIERNEAYESFSAAC